MSLFRHGGENACTIQMEHDSTGATATASFAAQLPIPIKLCESYFDFNLTKIKAC